ncbi:MAG: hypothetical protein K0S65_4660, partial [Labilithrix sp.]|nr:hypothetical protein [Labilithrix sp.]
TIEVEPSWLEILEERRRNNGTLNEKAAAEAAPEPAPEKKRSVRPVAAPARTKQKPIPRED